MNSPSRLVMPADSESSERPFPGGEVPPRKVAWLHPLQLLRTEFYALLSTYGTGLLDRRDVQAAQPPVSDAAHDAPASLERRPRLSRFAARFDKPATSYLGASNAAGDPDGALWVDYVADIGDSWDATYATLSLLARRTLQFRMFENGSGQVPRPQSEPQPTEPQLTSLPRAQVLVLGGDLVYPTPDRDAYRTRTLSAFMAALPRPGFSGTHPTLLAIPGNHDWYDGLTAFTREFCQGRRIGAWQTLQGRSYFAAKLPHNWWLFGIDSALDSRLDSAQQRYFFRVLTERHPAGCGKPRIVLCTAKPVWLEGPYRTDAAYRNLAEFADMLRMHDAETTVILAGDTHHYSHYVSAKPSDSEDGRVDRAERVSSADELAEHMFVVGGGGAYLNATHDLRPVTPEVTLKTSRRLFSLSPLTYPSQAASRRMVWGALKTAFRAESMPFALMVGLLYVVFASLWHTVGQAPPVFVAGETFRTQLECVLAKPPWAALAFGAALVALCSGIAVRATLGLRWLRMAWGAAHGALHLVAALWLLGWILEASHSFTTGPADLLESNLPLQSINPTIWHLAFVATAGLLGTTIFSIYLVISDRLLGWHTNEVFMVQSIINYRSFLRMRFDKDGTLTIYPIGLRETPTQWRARSVNPQDAIDPDNPSRYQPGDGTLDPVLIEAPIVVSPSAI